MGEFNSKNYLFLILLLMGAVDLPTIFRDEGSQFSPPKELVHSLETDSIRYDLWLVTENDGFPAHYYAEIFTPVCYSDKCYPVFTEFYWDLLGNFRHYEMPPGKALTKNDHEEFQPQEYQKMQEILSNESSLLGEYKAEDLVVEQREEMAQGVDAVTGATLKTLQNEVISGAVYSCYTLWHIAHGEISELVKAHTEGIQSDKMIHRFLQSQNHKYQYWAIDQVVQEDGSINKPFTESLLGILRGKNIFIAQYLLEKLSDKEFAHAEKQEWLWQTFKSSPYRLQMAILDKMTDIKIQKEIQLPLIQQLKRSNPAQQDKLIHLLGEQNRLSKPAQEELLAYLDHDKWGDEVYRILEQQKDKIMEVREALAQHKNLQQQK
ncbi:MAG: hypothetical protein WD398_01630 [Cyclobacteriaceae bacterium]